MPAPWPLALRERVVEAVDNGEGTMDEIAERFCVKVVSIYQWLKLRQETGSLMPRPMGGSRRRNRHIDAEGEAWLHETLDARPELTAPDLVALYRAARGKDIHPEVMRRTVHRLGYSFKKGHSGPSRRGGRTSSRREPRSSG